LLEREEQKNQASAESMENAQKYPKPGPPWQAAWGSQQEFGAC
jgi:hypothetical protein